MINKPLCTGIFYSLFAICCLLGIESHVSAKAEAPKAPQRIATGTIASDEIVYELLRRHDSLERLIAVSSLWGNSQYGHLNQDLIPDSVKGRVGTSVEALLALKPDLILLASYNRPEFIRQIQRAGPKVHLQQNFRSIGDIVSNILEIGQLIGTPKTAQQLTEELKKRLSDLQKKPLRNASGAKVSYLNFSSYGTFYGKNTSFNGMIEALDGINLAAEIGLEGWARINEELLITLDPDIIIASSNNSQQLDNSKLLNTLQQSSWRHIPAVQAGRVLVLSERDLLSISHHLMSSIEDIHRQVKELLEAKDDSISTKNDGS